MSCLWGFGWSWEAGTELGLQDGVLPKCQFLCICYICSKQHSQSSIQERLQARQLVAHVISHSLNSSLEPGLATLQLWEAVQNSCVLKKS